jgi:spore germination cell wall hydrolase CwlJ-like protein
VFAVAGLAFVLLAVLAWIGLAGENTRTPTFEMTEFAEPQRLPAAPDPAAEASRAEPSPLVGADAALHNAQAPFATLGPAAQPFRFAGTPADRLRARICLAAAMYYEAGDDPVGQLAVGQVVLNRVRHPAFPGSVCGVVMQGSDRATGCQFTFTCDGALDRGVGVAAQARAFAHADLMLNGMTFAGVGLATHYHTVDVYPWWSPKLEKIARVGAHLFFRWPGHWGSARAMLGSSNPAEPSSALLVRFGGAADPEIAAPMSSAQGEGAPVEITGAVAGAPKLAAQRAAGPSSGKLGGVIPLERRLLPPAPLIEQQAPLLTSPTLMGNRLLRMFPEQGVFFIELAPRASEATGRKAAALLCGGRVECTVYGWRNAAAAPQSARLDAAARASLAFSFVKAPSARTRSTPPSANAL